MRELIMGSKICWRILDPLWLPNVFHVAFHGFLASIPAWKSFFDALCERECLIMVSSLALQESHLYSLYYVVEWVLQTASQLYFPHGWEWDDDAGMQIHQLVFSALFVIMKSSHSWSKKRCNWSGAMVENHFLAGTIILRSKKVFTTLQNQWIPKGECHYSLGCWLLDQEVWIMFYFVWLFKIFTFLFATVDIANDQKHVI
jgi:hypothetical protein